MLQLASAHIDANGEIDACVSPRLHLAKRGTENPFAEFDRERMILDDGQEAARWNQTFVRMGPANQGLDTNDGAGTHVHFGLVVQDKLTGIERTTDILDIFVDVARAAMFFGIEELITILPGKFGLIHGLIRLPHQQIGVRFLFLRIERHPQTGGDLQRRFADHHRQRGGGQQTIQQRQAIGVVIEIREYRHELVAAQAREGVAVAQRLAHAIGQ